MEKPAHTHNKIACPRCEFYVSRGVNSCALCDGSKRITVELDAAYRLIYTDESTIIPAILRLRREFGEEPKYVL